MMSCVPEVYRDKRSPAPLVWKLARRIDRRGPDECWPWTGGLLKHSNAAKCAQGKPTRLLWALVYGPIPSGLCVLHKCDNPPCMNLRHLFLGTQLENIRDRDAKGRQARVRGLEHAGAKLSDDDVRAIRAHLANGALVTELTNRFNVSRSLIHGIASGRSRGLVS